MIPKTILLHSLYNRKKNLTMKYIKAFTILIICLLSSTQLSISQVTIGSKEIPVKAAILDMKTQLPDNENITSTKGGVVMPRIRLKDINTLEPIIKNSDPDLQTLKQSNVGLTIYNLTNGTNISEGLYAWNGSNWDAIITAKGETEAVDAKNGLSISSDGISIKLGGSLNTNTNIDHNNNSMIFNTGEGIFSVNTSDFLISKGNTGIGKIPSENIKLDVGGDIQLNNNLDVEGETYLKSTVISGAQLTYNPNNNRKKNKYLRAINEEGEARWVTLSGLSSPDMDPTPSNIFTFNPKTASRTEYQNTGMSVELGPGRWLVNYSVRLVMSTTPSASTGTITPSTLRFTLLDEDGNPTPTNQKKPYEDHRVYPDIGRNSCNGFIIVENNYLIDKTFYLGIRPQEIMTSWPDTNIQMINSNTSDSYLITLCLDDNI